MTGLFEIKEQRGEKGYYGKVLLEVEPDDTRKGCEITFDEAKAKNREWQDAARFGIGYAYSQIPRRELLANGHRVQVRLLQGHPFDTDSLIIAYAAVRALLNAFGKNEPDLVSFDAEAGRIVFKVKRGFNKWPQGPVAITAGPPQRSEQS
jgi:hypothetical protein